MASGGQDRLRRATRIYLQEIVERGRPFDLGVARAQLGDRDGAKAAS